MFTVCRVLIGTSLDNYVMLEIDCIVYFVNFFTFNTTKGIQIL